MPSVYKKCGTCKNTKDVSEFHKNRGQSDGLQSSCKECRKKPKPILRKVESKRCCGCKVTKKRDEFYKVKSQTGILNSGVFSRAS